MTAAEWGVITVGIAAIAWINWYFFATAVRQEDARAAVEQDKRS